MKILKISAFVLIVVGGIIFVVKYIDWKKTTQNRAYVVQNMRDPDSVQFRNEQLTNDGWLCGELNGKNAYGAYTGFKRFASRAEDNVWIEDSGYAGTEKKETKFIIESIQSEVEVMNERSDLMNKGINVPDLSSDEIKDLAKKRLFLQYWKKHCI